MKRWNVRPKILVISAVGLLLSIGLCSSVGNIMGDKGDAALLGLLLFILSMVGLIMGAFMSIVNGARTGDE